MTDLQLLRAIHESQVRLESKVDQLLTALAEDDDDQPARTLDGTDAGRQREEGQSLG